MADSGAPAEYVAPSACQGCHAEIWQTYRKTGMGRSFFSPRPENTIEDYNRPEPFYHEASDRYYEMILRDGRYAQRRYQQNGEGRAINVLEREIHFVMGSGNHARSYLHLSPDGKLTQMPLGWYAGDGGHWGMSPGYDRRNHDGFQRVISFDCMFCHNGYPEIEAGADTAGAPPRYRGAIPEGIDCQRCHGAGSAHVETATKGSATPDELASSIVNPARLPLNRQAEVCLQCHLETTSRPLPNIVRKYGRGVFSFRPGQRLGDYALYFDHAPATGWDDKFEINHSAYRLRQSRCFVESDGALTCTTCHDPHKPSGTDDARNRVDAACIECHGEGQRERPGDAMHEAATGCAACHMPRRRTDDVVHAVVTDHRIQDVPPDGLLSPKRERSTLAEIAYRGRVTPYYPESLPNPADELYLAIAQTAQGSNAEAGIAELSEAIRRHRPEEAGFYFELGAALDEEGRIEEAARWFEEAIARDAALGLARTRMVSALSRAGRHGDAEAALREASALDPRDPRVPKERGLNFARQGMWEEAAAAARAAIALDPALPELHNNLGGALAELGRLSDAERALREALRIQPDLAEARFNLGAILARRGDSGGAIGQWREAVRSKPDYAVARYNLAVLLASGDRIEEALAHLDAALAAEPGFEQARALRNRLATSGRGGTP